MRYPVCGRVRPGRRFWAFRDMRASKAAPTATSARAFPSLRRVRRARAFRREFLLLQAFPLPRALRYLPWAEQPLRALQPSLPLPGRVFPSFRRELLLLQAFRREFPLAFQPFPQVFPRARA